MAYVVAARWLAKEGEQDAVAEAVRELAAASPAEPGIRIYQAHRDPDHERVFFFYEQYVNRAAYDAHLESAHFAEHGFGNAVPRLETRERAFYETLGD